MPRLIDADALTSILEEWEEKSCDGTENDGSDGTTRVLHPVPTTTREMIDLIEDQPTIAHTPRWIPVMERLPEENHDGSVNAVLVTDGFVQHMAYFVRGEWLFTESGEMKEPMWYGVTHWMPLPNLPKEDSNE